MNNAHYDHEDNDEDEVDHIEHLSAAVLMEVFGARTELAPSHLEGEERGRQEAGEGSMKL